MQAKEFLTDLWKIIEEKVEECEFEVGKSEWNLLSMRNSSHTGIEFENVFGIEKLKLELDAQHARILSKISIEFVSIDIVTNLRPARPMEGCPEREGSERNDRNTPPP